MAQGETPTSVDPFWYKDAIIYETHVKTFCDSDGDGMGDFRGLIEKLDYLQELGITAIWLLPFYPSPLRDDGYDIADYFDVNPNFGTLDDFRAFLDAAHARNLHVITELVINHTSDQNPWFQKSRRAAPGSPEWNVRGDVVARTMRLIADGKAYSKQASDAMLNILLEQQYRSGIPAGLPKAVRVAHKTGNISTVHHDAGIVFVEGRRPYVLVILTQFRAEAGRGTAVADVSRDIYNTIAGMTYE